MSDTVALTNSGSDSSDDLTIYANGHSHAHASSTHDTNHHKHNNANTHSTRHQHHHTDDENSNGDHSQANGKPNSRPISPSTSLTQLPSLREVSAKLADALSSTLKPSKPESGIAREMFERHERVLNIYFANRPILRTLCQSSLRFVLPITIFCLVFPALVNYGVCPDVYTPNASSVCRTQATAVFGLFHVFSLITTAFSTALLGFELSHHIVNPWHLTSMYFSVIVHFASWYQLCYSGELFSLNFPDSDSSSDLMTRLVAFLYLSVSITTTAGLGELTPRLWYAKIIGITQMVISMLYTTGVFAIGLDHFRKQLDAQRQQQQLVEQQQYNQPREAAAAAASSSPLSSVQSFFNVDKYLNRVPYLLAVKNFLMTQLLFSTVILQLLLMALLIAAYGHTNGLFEKDAGTDAVNFLCIFFETLQFILIVSSTLRLVQSKDESSVSLWFLLQSYLSVCALFGGVYFTLYVLAGSHSFDLRSLDESNLTVPSTFGEFIYLSVVIMSTTGFGDDVPIHTASRIFVSFEMLTGVFYAVVILGIGVARVMHAWETSRVELPPMPTEFDESQV